MKKIAILMGIAAMISLALPAFAADAAQSFGVIDMNKVMQTTDAAKEIFSQLEGKRKEYQTNISKEEESLRAAEQAIIKQKDTLSKEAFDKKRNEFEEKVISGQKLVQDRKRILDQAFNSSMMALRNAAAKVVADVAKEKGFSAVFTQDAVMISTPDMDITDVVIERMNKSVKKIPVDWSAAASGPAKGGNKK